MTTRNIVLILLRYYTYAHIHAYRDIEGRCICVYHTIRVSHIDLSRHVHIYARIILLLRVRVHVCVRICIIIVHPSLVIRTYQHVQRVIHLAVSSENHSLLCSCTSDYRKINVSDKTPYARSRERCEK